MKKPPFISFHIVTAILCCLLSCTQAYSQKTGIDEWGVFKKYIDSSTQPSNTGRSYYLVSSRGDQPLPHKVARQVSENIYIISLDAQQKAKLNKEVSLAPANDQWKLSPALENIFEKNKTQPNKFILSATDADALSQTLKEKYPQLTIIKTDGASGSLVVECSSVFLKEQLLQMPEIIFADALVPAKSETNIIGYNRSLHGINALDFLIPGADGKNIVAGIKEQAMDENDLDLWKRILPSPVSATTISTHSTVIASIIGGAGNSSYDGRGIAHGSKFFPSSFSHLFADDASVLNAAKVSVQNHSYGTAIQQFYGAEALSYDVLTWNNKIFIPVMSAGNSGQLFATEGKYANLAGFANLTGNFKMAKNVITVGAIDDKENIAPQSSAGPVYDGRLAPQLTALGPNGTSDAAAMVTGTIAVMQQVYADSNNNSLPPASLVKALLYNTTDDIYRKGIDYKTGYGLLNSYQAVRSLQNRNYDGSSLEQDGSWNKIITVPFNTAEIKVTLAWTDTAAGLNNYKALVNDLDMKLVELSTGKEYYPWVLNATANADSLMALPIRKRDSLNTAEQVSISLPAAGSFEIIVMGTSVPGSAIPFHISYKTESLHSFSFTSPLHASDVRPSSLEDATIRWRSFVADTNETGSLFISYDEGQNWQLLKSSIKLYKGKYPWKVKDTTAIALLKMETSFGNFLSATFLVAPPTLPQLDFNCADSFRLSWNKNLLAGSYKIFALTENPYLQQVLNITDSFVVLKKQDYPSRIYAVEPVLQNGVPAARSIAINIEEQGVACFYRSLNYQVLQGNIVQLLLELSVAGYADSIFFERLDAGGMLLQSYPAMKAGNAAILFQQMAGELPSGINYFRAVIRLKNGARVYTETISVSVSGKKKILFYPNPADKKLPLKYLLEQGVSPDCGLQFFDVTGRMILNLESLTDEIDISELPSGVVFYRLVEFGKVLEVGKVIVR